MAIPSLLGTYIDETYQRLVQTDGTDFADGLGNPITFGPGTLSGGTDKYIPLWSGSNALTSSFLNQTQNILATKSGSVVKGLSIDLQNNVYSFGEAGGNEPGLSLYVDNGTNRVSIDDLTNSFRYFEVQSRANNTNGGTILEIDDINNQIRLQASDSIQATGSISVTGAVTASYFVGIIDGGTF